MKSGSSMRAAAVAAVALLWTPSAVAQTTSFDKLSVAEQDEIYCVSDELIVVDDDVYDVVEAYLYADDSEQIERAKEVLKAASDACSADYKWGASKRMLSETITVSSLAVDYLTEELLLAGLKEEQVELIFVALDKLPTEDLTRFLDDSWLDDAAFVKRLNGALAAAKYPGDDENNLEDARLIMEGAVKATAGIADWVRQHGGKQ